MSCKQKMENKDETKHECHKPTTDKEHPQQHVQNTTQPQEYKFLHPCSKTCCTEPIHTLKDIGVYLIDLDGKKTKLNVSPVCNQHSITLDNIDSEVNVPCSTQDGNVLVCDESIKHWIVKYTTTDVALLKEDGSVVPGRHVIEVEKSNNMEEMMIKTSVYNCYGCSRFELWEVDPCALNEKNKQTLLFSNDQVKRGFYRCSF